MTRQSEKILMDQLVRGGLVDKARAESLLAEASASSVSLRQFLLGRQIVDEVKLVEAMATLYRLPVVNLGQLEIPAEVAARVPVRFATYYKIMPVKIDGKSVVIASAIPLDVKILDEIRIHLGFDPQNVLATEDAILQAQKKSYGLAAATVDRMAKQASGTAAEPAEAVEDIDRESDEASVIQLVNQILLDAFHNRATDIHIEPYRNKVRVRYRIDGVLMDANIPEAVRQFLPSIISRIKIMSNLSIVERRVPQDGSAVVNTKEQILDLRVSIIPTPRGESMVIRILPSKMSILSLDKLGISTEHCAVFRSLVQRPHGIVLVTGPTGSGKTTTLYACLNEINTATRKIITLEDPIEYEMEGITQIQVNPKFHFDFATGLRSVLRHDPDIIMVGEIRDLETAEIAIRTALTGHLVFSTLHTNDAASGITRLLEMGVEPFLVSSSIEAFVAQRLVRNICPKCKEAVGNPPAEIQQEIAVSLGLEAGQEVSIFRGRGCEMCHQTGFYGRTAIYEILLVNDEIRAAIVDRRGAEEIKRLAMARGMTTLRQDGWQKVVAGVTTPEEVMNVTVPDKTVRTMPAAEKGMIPVAPAKNIERRQIKPELLQYSNQYDSRVYTRIDAKVQVRYFIFHQDKDNPDELTCDQVQHASITKDLSAGGVRFISVFALPIDTVIEVHLQLKPDEPGIQCLARVCRVEDDAFSAMFHLAAYFLDISSGDRVRIEDFVSQYRRDQPG